MDSQDKKILSVDSKGNNFYFVLEPHDINRLQALPQGCVLELNLGRTIDLLGGNVLELSSDLIVNVTLISDKFLED